MLEREPSSSAAICAIAVRVPVPMSCIAVTTAARGRRSRRGSRRTSGGPPPPYQIWRREADAALPRSVAARAHLVAPLPVRLGAAVALEQVLRRERAAVGEVGVRVVAAPQLERVDVELRRELVEQALEPERALDEAGRAERGASAAGSASRRSCVVRTFVAGVEHLHRALRGRRPAGPADGVHELAAEGGRACRRSARRRVSRWIVALRLPAATFSSRRVSAHAHRAGPSVFASAAAMSV